MNAIVRALIVWLLMLALPYQASAAAAALPCETAAAPALSAPAHDHHAMMMMAAANGDHHEAMMMMAAANGHQHQAMMSSSHDGHAQPEHAAHHSGAKCGSCPACWAGPAMAHAFLAAVFLPPAASVLIPFDAGHVPTVHLSLPERPPRQLLA